MFIGGDIILLVYVDDCLIFSRDKDKINQLIDKLKNKEKLDLTDEGDVEKYLGVEIERKNKTIVNYGLKQAGHNWFEKQSSTLGNLLINPSKVDPCVFIGDNIIVLVYVDDCFIFSRDKDKITS